VRGAEVNAARARLDDGAGLCGDMLGCPAEREAVQHLVRDQGTRSGVIPGRHEFGDRGDEPVRQPGRSVERADDCEVHGHLGSGSPTRGGTVFGDHGDRARDDPDAARHPSGGQAGCSDPLLGLRDDRRAGGAAHLEFIGDLSGEGGSARPPRAEQQRRDAGRQRGA
jgi:hypothetical protein